MASMKKHRVLILGGGFGGLYAALEFEKRNDPDFEVTTLRNARSRSSTDSTNTRIH
jgi:NADH dehydrogenase FAD-containing subunit